MSGRRQAYLSPGTVTKEKSICESLYTFLIPQSKYTQVCENIMLKCVVVRILAFSSLIDRDRYLSYDFYNDGSAIVLEILIPYGLR